MERFTTMLVSNESAQMLPDKIVISYKKISTEATESGGPMGGCKIEDMQVIIVPTRYRTGFTVFRSKYFKVPHNLIIWKPVFTLLIQILLKLWTLSLKNDTITTKVLSQKKHPKNTKNVQIYLALRGSGLEIFLSRSWDTFVEVILAKIWECWWEEKDLTTQCWPMTLSAYTLWTSRQTS